MAIGAGWQVRVAYLSVGSYFLFGLPIGALMAYKFDMGLKVTVITQYMCVIRPIKLSHNSQTIWISFRDFGVEW